MTRVCLNMIVKNEVLRMTRCLDSVAPHLSTYVVGDTGSSDGTQALIRDFMGSHGIRGMLYEAPFTNFRDSRNLGLEQAKKWRGEVPWDYLLLCDADMQLEAPEGFGELTAPGYQMLQRSGSLEYYNARLVRWDNECRYCCPTHEYLSTEQQLEKLQGPWFRDHADGSNRPGKVERDIAVLTIEVDRDQNDARSWFYLANSLRELGRYEEAIGAYEKRIALAGWAEEIAMSWLYMSRCARALGWQSPIFG